MRKVYALTIAVLASSFSWGQVPDSLSPKPKRHQLYLNLGSGYTLQSVRDMGVSSLRYDGPQATFIGELIDKTPFGEHNIQGRFDFGEITASQSGASMTVYRGAGFYRYLRKIKFSPIKNLHFTAGGSVDAYWNLRQHQAYSNNSFNNEFYLNLGPSTRAYYSLKVFKQKFGISYAAQMPLINFVVRPGFTGTYFEDFVNNQTQGIAGAAKSGYLVGLGKYFRFQNELGLDYFLKGGNGFKVSYIWDYYKLQSDFNPVNAGYRTVQASLIFKF